MTEPSPQPLLRVRHLEGPWFNPVSFDVLPGRGVLVHCADGEALDSLLDIISGLAPPGAGGVEWFGTDPHAVSEAARHKLRQQTGYATAGAGLISNLKIWENIVLPMQARGLASTGAEIEQLEARMVDVFVAAGYHEDWIGMNLRESVDLLDDFERIVCCIARSYLAGFRLLVADGLFGGIDSVRTARLAGLLDWVGARMPDSGLLLLHQGRAGDGAFGLRTWQPVETVSLEPR